MQQSVDDALAKNSELKKELASKEKELAATVLRAEAEHRRELEELQALLESAHNKAAADADSDVMERNAELEELLRHARQELHETRHELARHVCGMY